MHRIIQLAIALAMLALCGVAAAAEYHGQVTFGGFPAPGATVKATQGSKQFATTTDEQGLYSFPDLTDGTWTIEVEMTGFSTLKQDVVIGPNAPAGKWELKLLPLDQIKAEIRSGAEVAPGATPVEGAGHGAVGARHGVPVQAKGGSDEGKARANGEGKERASEAGNKGENNAGNTNENSENGQAPGDELNQHADDGLLINGSVLNGAATRFAQAFAFGNYRNRGGGLYNGGIGLIFDNSALDARPFSLSGQNTPKPAYNRITGVATLGGPLRIPHLIERHAPNFFVAYQWTRYVNDTTQSALVPDAAERGGDFSQALNALGQPVQIFNPATGLPFSGNMIPPTQISPQAQALLNFYPLPSFSGDPRYNYQIPIIDRHASRRAAIALQRVHSIPRTSFMAGLLFKARGPPPRICSAFSIHTDALGINTNINWSHRLSQRLFLNSWLPVQPLGDADQRPTGRIAQTFPAMRESRGTIKTRRIGGRRASLSRVGSRDCPTRKAPSIATRRMPGLIRCCGAATVTTLPLGGDFRRQQFNYLAQQNPRGMFTFTGAATQGSANGTAIGGDDFADFLLGIPDTSSLAFRQCG